MEADGAAARAARRPPLRRANGRYLELVAPRALQRAVARPLPSRHRHAVEALKHYLAAYEAPADTTRYKLAALREAADLALTRIAGVATPRCCCARARRKCR